MTEFNLSNEIYERLNVTNNGTTKFIRVDDVREFIRLFKKEYKKEFKEFYDPDVIEIIDKLAGDKLV